MNKLLIGAVLMVIFTAGIFLTYQNRQSKTPSTPSTSNKNQTENSLKKSSLSTKPLITVEDLEIPWSITLTSEKELLVAERPGRIQLINSNGEKQLIAEIKEVLAEGEGGLLGLTLHPDFQQNNYLYVYYTYGRNGDNTFNRVVRYTFKNNEISDPKTIVDKIPGALFHNGGRIKFGPDKYLYITTGDAQNPSLAQDLNSLAGKILRVTPEGESASGNPFNNLIFSYGHRNPQGLAWDSQNRLWATEHGPFQKDELNLIEAGKNYGWPLIQGDQKREGLVSPVMQSGNNTWAPAGAVFFNKKLYFTGLRGNALFEFDPENSQSGLREYFKGEYGRLRDIILGSDNTFYITTSNRDGRGSVKKGDDKIINVNHAALNR